ncbi:uncharacterized protein A4U43_C08F32980 [Asparagus officinalis]|uniref:ubiquitin-conjugating enzyme E2 7-like n=1 Tax=Asparagus officinalis TaxID=4686 RepID=UPI00098E1EC2|nr:ubiquitin-conjugating enzyme E2 7-like [Asparagus officinalis]ONK61730.1 uncharacterized protein A4U43_C08F32980 [Asparagus officinalis]
MSTPVRKRLMRDFKRLQNDLPAGISGAPQDNNIMLWNTVIFGPDDTPWDGAKSEKQSRAKSTPPPSSSMASSASSAPPPPLPPLSLSVAKNSFLHSYNNYKRQKTIMS